MLVVYRKCNLHKESESVFKRLIKFESNLLIQSPFKYGAEVIIQEKSHVVFIKCKPEGEGNIFSRCLFVCVEVMKGAVITELSRGNYNHEAWLIPWDLSLIGPSRGITMSLRFNYPSIRFSPS